MMDSELLETEIIDIVGTPIADSSEISVQCNCGGSCRVPTEAAEVAKEFIIYHRFCQMKKERADGKTNY